MTDQTGYGRKRFKSARHHLYEIICVPVQEWITAPPARRTDAAYRVLTEIPMELANHGYRVTLSRPEDKWSIEVEREITSGSMLRIHGEAGSFVAALFQISTQVNTAVADLEAKARRAWEAGETLEDAA